MANEVIKSENTQNNLWKASRGSAAKPMIPAVDIYESKDALTLLADLPGVTKDSLSVDIENDVLTIEGGVRIDIPEDAAPLHAEVNSRRYLRSFTLSRELDTERIQAEVKDGLLTLTIPKAESARPRKIPVQMG